MHKNIVNIENLNVQIGQQMILRDVSFSVKESEIVGIIGPNGCGKTTLLNTISGFVPVETGTISINNQDVMSIPPYQRAILGVGRSFQNAGVFKDLSVEENIIIGAEKFENYPWWWMFSSKHRHKMDKIVDEALSFVDLLAHKKTIAGMLSGGQLRLLELSRLKLFKGNLLLIDEPTAGVAPILRQKLATMIRHLNQECGFTIMIVEHDLKFLFDLVDRVIVLVDGKKYLEGRPEEIQKDKRLQEIYFGNNKKN
jgi:branched-chain amino acid transport system ATP-binding protein